MALNAGKLTLTVEYGQGLKDKDWFGRMDPYCVLTCGSQTARTKTHTDGGRNPVWNQTFPFNIINENTATVAVFDEDTLTRDDAIGTAVIDLAKARQTGADRVMAPVVGKRSGRQHGFVSVTLKYESNAVTTGAAAPQQQQYMPVPAPGMMPAYPYPAPQPPYPAYGAPQPAPYPAMYAAAPYGMQPVMMVPMQQQGVPVDDRGCRLRSEAPAGAAPASKAL